MYIRSEPIYNLWRWSVDTYMIYMYDIHVYIYEYIYKCTHDIDTRKYIYIYIDDPIRGYTVRTNDHRRRLQGFIWFTTFTSWTHFFKWDSKSPAAGLRGTADKHRIRWYYF
jgi:hypothetical protein